MPKKKSAVFSSTKDPRKPLKVTIDTFMTTEDRKKYRNFNKKMAKAHYEHLDSGTTAAKRAGRKKRAARKKKR